MTITQKQRLAEHHKRSFFSFPGYSYDDDELLRPDQVFHNTRAEEDNRLLCDCVQYRKAYTTHYCARPSLSISPNLLHFFTLRKILIPPSLSDSGVASAIARNVITCPIDRSKYLPLIESCSKNVMCNNACKAKRQYLLELQALERFNQLGCCCVYTFTVV